ncbi:uncharacterized protein LOC126833859 [Adelges cooleyi]|uniref:uncharacterized protein LOC126833859 n=1 Tax=Adelges cooleyi TaxID=133065 RepID=UPI002180100B|nr:uncharacterized protein LOC126833859 [Adelges cooleyi]
MMKTKCYYFVLSLTFVSILPLNAVDCSFIADRYTKRVTLTNFYISKADEEEKLPDLIEKFIRGDVSSEEISYMFAVPEKANRHLQHSIRREKIIRNVLSNLMEVPVPSKTVGVPDMTLLPGLGFQRRELTKDAIRSLIFKLSSVPAEIIDRFLCRSIGLLRSVQDPDSFITSDVIERGTCNLISTIGDVVKSSKYKYVDGVVLQVEIGGTNQTEPLFNQLE